MRTRMPHALLAVLFASPAFSADMPGNAENQQAVREVLAGKRPVANAAWWGFNDDDATAPLQAAIA